MYLIFVLYVFGLVTMLAHIFYSFFATITLFGADYIEHYGLVRQANPKTGVVEPINVRISWNAPQTLFSYMAFKVQRHSDHHMNVYKPYQILNHTEDSPLLP